MVIKLVKKRTNSGLPVNLYYWRDKTGHEVDIIIDNGEMLVPLEIKAAKTISNDFFKNLLYWNGLSGMKKGYLVYTGEEMQKRSNGIEVINLMELSGREM